MPDALARPATSAILRHEWLQLRDLLSSAQPPVTPRSPRRAPATSSAHFQTATHATVDASTQTVNHTAFSILSTPFSSPRDLPWQSPVEWRASSSETPQRNCARETPQRGCASKESPGARPWSEETPRHLVRASSRDKIARVWPVCQPAVHAQPMVVITPRAAHRSISAPRRVTTPVMQTRFLASPLHAPLSSFSHSVLTASCKSSAALCSCLSHGVRANHTSLEMSTLAHVESCNLTHQGGFNRQAWCSDSKPRPALDLLELCERCLSLHQ